MSRILFLLLAGLFPFNAHANAGELSCYGEIDPGAGYRITAKLNQELHVSGEMSVRYEDDDGFIFSTEMKPTVFEIRSGRSIQVHGPFQGGTIALTAAYTESEGHYDGLLIADGVLGEGFMVDVICRIHRD